MLNFFIYFLIGSILQLAIIYNRTEIRKVASLDDINFDDLATIIMFFAVIAVNVILWPITIIVEMYNIHNGL